MKKFTPPIGITLGLLLSSSAALADEPILLTVPSSQSGYTTIPSGATTVWSDNGHTVSIGKDQTSCFRFDSLSQMALSSRAPTSESPVRPAAVPLCA